MPAEDVEHGPDGAAAPAPAPAVETTPRATAESSPTRPRSPAAAAARPVAAMRNLYTAALSYNGYTVTDGALRLIVLLHAADLGYVKRFSHHPACKQAALSQGSGLTYPTHTPAGRGKPVVVGGSCCVVVPLLLCANVYVQRRCWCFCVFVFFLLQVHRHRDRVHVQRLRGGGRPSYTNDGYLLGFGV